MTEPVRNEPVAAEPVLQLDRVTKRFPGVLALDEVSLEIRPHEVVGLIGENGAGKSTLLKILSGVYRPDEGTVRMRGQVMKFRSPRESARAGIGMVHQEQSLVGAVTVGENIMLGAEAQSIRGGIYNWSDLHARAQRQLDKIGSPINTRASVESLTFAQRQMVELAKALGVEEQSNTEPIIVLDEPTSVLEDKDLETLFAEIERLRQMASVVFVSHRLDEVLRVSDRVYVMKDGRCVAERDPDTVDTDELYRLMVGRESTGEFYRESEQRSVEGSDPVLVATGLGKRGSYGDVNLTVRAGEVVGIAGVLGSGREELCRSLFGAEPFDQGTLRLQDRVVRFNSPVDAVRAGVGYIPAERRFEGIAAGMSVRDNMLLVDPGPVSTGPFLSRAKVKALTSEWINRLRVKTPSPQADVGNLSGGNQQKVVLAKWLMSPRLKLLILDHPTRGLDVGAKEDVYTFVRQLCAQGIAIVLLADTLEETISLSHTVLVMQDGKVRASFDAHPGNKPSPVQLVEQMV